MYYYEVAPLKIVRQTAHVFTYHSSVALDTGAIVSVPVGTRSHIGVVMGSVPRPAFETRELGKAIYDVPLPRALLAAASWMSEYYATHLSLVLSALLPRGVDKQRRVRPTASPTRQIRDSNHYTPTKDQAAAIEQVSSSSHTTHLLFGVTGSGKTLVYKQLARAQLAAGNSVIILVPEIALTSQIVDEFTQDFGGQVLLTHSQQTEAERHAVWQQALLSDTPLVAIGPRSALFLPLRRIGLIVVDEMHEPSYKQEQSPRYSALRVATILAQQHDAKVVFGSATPPVAEFYAATQAGAPIISLPNRAQPGAVKSDVHLVDMKQRGGFSGHRFLSDKLIAALTNTLENGKQVLLFHNRRGSASVTLCEHCGWTAVDPETSTPLTLHSDSHQLVSHVSGYTTNVPTMCPVCRHSDIIHKGIGTKLIESEMKRLFPNKKVVRFDGDSGREHSVDERYAELYSGEIDIIIGTQVVAKGIDLPHLGTLGVIQADSGLVLPDFVSAERVFQLLSQAVGRVGRSSQPTTAIVQSYHPTHPAVAFGTQQDYHSFYAQEIDSRRHYHFPPFRYLLKFVCAYKTEAAAIKNAKAFAEHIRKDLQANEDVLGPTPAFYEQQGGNYRWQIVVRSHQRARLVALIEQCPKNPHWQYEVDPVTLL